MKKLIIATAMLLSIVSCKKEISYADVRKENAEVIKGYWRLVSLKTNDGVTVYSKDIPALADDSIRFTRNNAGIRSQGVIQYWPDAPRYQPFSWDMDGYESNKLYVWGFGLPFSDTTKKNTVHISFNYNKTEITLAVTGDQNFYVYVYAKLSHDE